MKFNITKPITKLITEKSEHRFSRIRSVGLELEGGCCEKCLGSLREKYGTILHLQAGGDGSVTVNGECKTHGSSYWDCEREIRAWATEDNLPLLWEFVKALWSTGFKQNRTCGNHVHVKFDNKDVFTKFRAKESWQAFEKNYRRVFKGETKFISRLRCNWSSSLWEPDVITSPYKVYKMINPGSIQEHGTLEFRVLPYFISPDEAIESYDKMLAVIDEMASQ